LHDFGRNPDNTENVAYVNWDGNRWVQNWNWLDNDFNGNCRLLRRKFFYYIGRIPHAEAWGCHRRWRGPAFLIK